ncbi:MAG: CoA transferase, partial [Paenibacillaceae bacterium]|nr:CoA transferase [Paenibacillaceae bacterium]
MTTSLFGFCCRKSCVHDLAYLAMAGALAYKGQLRQPPRRGSLPVADLVGGACASVAILAAIR